MSIFVSSAGWGGVGAGSHEEVLVVENGQITYMNRYPASYTALLYDAGACRLDSDHVILIGGDDHSGNQLVLFAIHQISDDTWDKQTGMSMKCIYHCHCDRLIKIPFKKYLPWKLSK